MKFNLKKTVRLAVLSLVILSVFIFFVWRYKPEYIPEFYPVTQEWMGEIACRVPLLPLKEKAGNIDDLYRSLRDEDLSRILAQISCGLVEYSDYEELFAKEGVYCGELPEIKEQDGVLMRAPWICYDAVRDRWFITASGVWTREIPRRDAEFFNDGKVGGTECLFLRFICDSGIRSAVKSTYGFLFSEGQEVKTGNRSGGIWPATFNLQDTWDDGYNAQQVAAVIALSRDFVSGAGEIVMGYIHTPKYARYKDPTAEDGSVTYQTTHPEEVFVRYSDSTLFY